MTPKEKAEELVGKFKKHSKENRTSLGATPGKFKNINHSKQCALLTVDEIIESRKEDKGFNDTLLSRASEYWTAHPMYLTYWREVKQEIEKL